MKIVNKKITDVKPYGKNAKKHDQTQIDNVAESIKQFGWQQPLVIDKNNVVIIGHCRLLGAKKLGLEEVPCVLADDLDEEQVNKLRLLDNKLNESEWDFDLLGDDIEGLDFDGFDIDWGLPEEPVELEGEDDYVPEIDEHEEPKTKRGDIYILGDHRLMCGDSTMIDDVEKLMNGNKADLLFTDPPYNVSMESKSKDVLKSNNYAHIENDDLSLDEFQEFLGMVFTNANLMLKDDASYYVFSCQGGDQERTMMMMMRESGIRCRHQIIWVKDAPVFSMGRLDYDYKHEPILYGWKERHNFYRKGEQDKSVWQYNRTANKLHPTMKPVELIENALMNSTLEGDIVLDLFGGSGSTLIACEKRKRKCCMMEFDPHYCDIIVKRWEDLTGKKAELLGE